MKIFSAILIGCIVAGNLFIQIPSKSAFGETPFISGRRDALHVTAIAAKLRRDVFIGGTGPNYAGLANAANISQMLANGRIGLYQHAIATNRLTAAQRQALWATWGLDACGTGDTVGEVGGGPSGDYLAVACGKSPGEVNSNETFGAGTYIALATDALPGHIYTGYLSAPDLANLKTSIKFYVSRGAPNAGVFLTPNDPGQDYADPFATGSYWANVRAAALFGGALALDVPPSYAFDREPAYRDMLIQMIVWARAQRLRISLVVSPYGLVADSHGHIGACEYDSLFETNTRRLVVILMGAKALPTQWGVENYCPTAPDGAPGTPNDIGVDGTPNTLNAVALYLANVPQAAVDTAASPPRQTEP